MGNFGELLSLISTPVNALSLIFHCFYEVYFNLIIGLGSYVSMDSGTTKLTMRFLCEHRVTNFELTNKGSNVTVN